MTKNYFFDGDKRRRMPHYLLKMLFWGGFCFCYPVGNSFAEAKANEMYAVKQNEKATTITGVVFDDQDTPLIGATVLVKGTQTGAVTDLDGRFSLKAAKGDVLVVSYIGMLSKEVTVTEQKNYKISLTSNTELLNEVVVTGYQTLSKERSTGAFSKVSTKKLETKRLDNLKSILEGQVAGYVDGKIRGVTTMNAVANPMVVIDGFPVENTSMDRSGRTTENMPDLNPEDIESVTILKDAAAASIYGARAANGVIVITTKRAKEGKAEVSFSSTFTVQPYSYYKDRLTNAADIVALQREWASSNTLLQAGGESAMQVAGSLRDDGAYPSKGVDILLDMYTNKISQAEGNRLLDELASKGYQYYDQAEKYGKRNPFYQQYNLRVAQSTERNAFSFSSTYWNNQYEDIHHDDWKLGFNINNSLKVTKWMQLDLGMYLKYGKQNTQSYDLFNPEFSAVAYDGLVNPDGSYISAVSQIKKENRDLIARYGLHKEIITPMRELGYNLGEMKDLETRAFAKLKIDFTSWLNYNVMFQYETSDSDYMSLMNKESNRMQAMINKFATESNGSVKYNLPDGHARYTNANQKRSYNFRQQLNFNKTFAEKHNLVWILGQEIRDTKLTYEDSTVYGYDPELLTWNNINAKELSSISGILGYASLDQNSIGSERELVNRFVSFYSNASYTFDDKYVVSGSLRWDRSNLWGTSSKYQKKPLWSVGGSWNIDKESFFHLAPVNMLKLRASYGVGGNIGRNTAPYLIAKYYPSNVVDGLYGMVTTPPNKDIRWEKTTTIDVGVDFALFNHRLSGSVDYYHKNSVDLLANINGSPTQGFGYSTLTTNNGKMKNHGIEITLNGQLIRTKDFSWESSLIYSFNKNKVTAVNVKPGQWNSRITMPTSYPMEGKPLNGIYAYPWAGLDENGDPQVYDQDGNITSKAVQNADALRYCGTTVPVHSGSWNNVLRYKDFEFSALIIFDAGHKLRSSRVPSINMGDGRIVATDKSIVDRWQKPGDQTDVPRLLFANDKTNYNTYRSELWAYSDKFVCNASNIRLNNLSLAYRVPAQWCKKVYLSNARVQFNVENVGVLAFDKDAHYDLGGKVKPNFVWGLYLNF